MQNQPLTPTRRNTKPIPLSAKPRQESITAYTMLKESNENTESPKKPLATITNRAVQKIPDSPERKKTGRQSKTNSPVTTPKSRLSASVGSPNCILPASPLSKRTLDLQHDLFKVYQDSVSNSPEKPRNLPLRRRSIDVDSNLASSLELEQEAEVSHHSDSSFQELEQKLNQQIQENGRLRKELDEEKRQRKALEEDHKLQDEFIKALEKQLTEIKLSNQAKCQSLERELKESNELLEECRSLLEEVHGNTSSSF